jgi:hypothetical protein
MNCGDTNTHTHIHKPTKLWLENLKGRDHMGVLKWVQPGFNWLKTAQMVGFQEHSNGPLISYKQGIS